MKIGDIVSISKGQHYMLGFVVKVYDASSDKSPKFFVKSITDDFPDYMKKRSWNRYGIKDDGLYIDSRHSSHESSEPTAWCKRSDLKVAEDAYYTTTSKSTTRVICDLSPSGLMIPKRPDTTSAVRVYQFDAEKYGLDPRLSFTYVYLQDHDVGRFAPTTSEDARNLAYYRARKYHLETLIESLENKFLNPDQIQFM